MLTGRATASVISYAGCLGLSPVYFSEILCASQPKIAKNSPKTHIFGVQGRSRSSMLVPPESSSAVLLMIRSKSVSICNRSHARLVDSSRNRTFSRGYPNLMRSYGGLRKPIHCQVVKQVDPRFAASRHTTTPISHTRPSPRSP